METTPATFLHDGTIGDVWAAIPAMRTYWEKTGRKIILYLTKDRPAEYYFGSDHPTKEDGKMVMLNQKMIDMMRPLLKAQSFISDVLPREVDAQEPRIMIDLNMIRMTNIGMPNGSINRWYFQVLPDMSRDLTKPWLEVPDTGIDYATDKILINRTERYLNPNLDYGFLRDYQDECVFMGTMREYTSFTTNFDLEIEKVNVNNFLEFAQAVKQCRFYIGNQSQGYQLAQGIFKRSMLEYSFLAQNVMPVGPEMYDYCQQLGMEWHFHALNGTTPVFLEKLARQPIPQPEPMLAKDAEKEIEQWETDQVQDEEEKTAP
ncbi:MAG: hypothetical protein C5B59_07975 [Bacteroidetes bacterium]|nr:MAG: hypothetical protein C5B59_07975 [Bacteroidota bacterium]